MHQRTIARLTVSCPVASGLVFALGTALFWGLRAWYWNITVEAPFSDMADFETMALRLLQRGEIAHRDFWVTYRPPVLPIFRAGVMAIFGRDEQLIAWHWCLAAVTFMALVWMSYEVSRVTQRPWLGLTMLLVIASAKPSIFWSLKVASEGLAEAMLYASIAITLLAERSRSRTAFLLAGFTYAVTFLTRPLYVIVGFAAPAFFLARELVARRRAAHRTSLLHTALPIGLILLGLAVGWSPWLIRSYRLYGHIVPLTTQGAQSFLWEIWQIKVTLDDGEVVDTTIPRLLSEAPKRFRNDYEAAQYDNRLLRQWLRENWRSWLRGLGPRIRRSATEPVADLTHVSRVDLFPGTWDRALPDKTPTLLATGLLGLVILTACRQALGILLIVTAGSWGFGVLFLGLPRLLDPVVPLLLAGNAGWVVAVGWVARRVRANGPEFGE